MSKLRAIVSIPFALALATTAFLAATVHSPGVVVREASAKSSYESPYSYEQTWNSALRLVRVDLGLKVSEKDDKNGYLLFEYAEKERVSTGSIELIRGTNGVRVVCQIALFPSYTEGVILNRLTRKMKEEYGTPPDKPAPTPPDSGVPSGDAGDSEGGGS